MRKLLCIMKNRYWNDLLFIIAILISGIVNMLSFHFYFHEFNIRTDANV